jgi:hypothetical protein
MSADDLTVTLTMPIVLTREHSPNGRLHHQVKAAVVARLREDARRAAMSHVNDPAWRQRGGWAALGWDDKGASVLMDVVIEWPKGRRLADDDNAKASLKPVVDGIADALWGGEDRHVELGTVTQTRGSGGLVITLRRQPDRGGRQ